MHSPTPPPRTAERTFAPAASSVSAARRFVRDCLEQWDQEPVVWTAQLERLDVRASA